MAKTFLSIVHVALLVAGAALCVWAVVVTAFGAEPPAIALQRAVPAVALLGLVCLYAALLWRRGFRPLSLVAFVPSYLCLGIVVSSWSAAWVKNFAPATAQEASAGKTEAIVWLVGSFTAAFLLALYVHRPSGAPN